MGNPRSEPLLQLLRTIFTTFGKPLFDWEQRSKNNTMRSLFLLIASVFLQLAVFGQTPVPTLAYVKDPHSDPPEHIVSLIHVDAELAFIPEKWEVTGDVNLTFIPKGYETDSMVFITPGFNMKRVLIEGAEVDYQRKGRSLVVYPDAGLQKGKEYTITMSYTSRPVATGIYFVGWRPEEAGKRKQIWAHRPFGWLPYMDSRVTMDIRIRFDKDFTVFTNGERISVQDNPDGTRTWHYRLAKNHPYFSTALGIGDYDYKEMKTGGGVPLELLYYRGMEEKVDPTYQFTPEMFDFFIEEIGSPYPYSVYREIPVIDYMYGGMECTTATIFGDYMLIDPRAYWQRNYINVNAHELAHQWFGDCIGHLAHKDVWLTESFGTYYAKIFERSVLGEEYYQNMIREEQQAALEASKLNSYPVGSSRGGRARIYDKGSLVLGMLRDVMGEQTFRDVIHEYFEQFKYGSASTADFFRIVYDETGQPYSWFFDQWILRPGEPHYRVSYRVLEDTTGLRNTLVSVEQFQEVNDLTGLFRMPVWLQVWYRDGSCDSVKTWIAEQAHEIAIPNPEKKKIGCVLVDPGNRILKRVIFEKSFEELAFQALNAPRMIDRYDALLSLKGYSVEQKRDLLIRVFENEHFHLTKSEVLKQLSEDRSGEIPELFRAAINDPDAKVREAVLMVMDPIPASLQKDAESLLQDESYRNVELALDRLCSDFPEDATRYLETTKDETGWRGKNIRMKWLQIAIMDWKLDHLAELISYTGIEQEFETRMNAFFTLMRLGYMDENIAKNAVEASGHWNRKLATAAREYLSYFSKQEEYKKMIHD